MMSYTAKMTKMSVILKFICNVHCLFDYLQPLPN